MAEKFPDLDEEMVEMIVALLVEAVVTERVMRCGAYASALLPFARTDPNTYMQMLGLTEDEASEVISELGRSNVL
jgi:hypothetical protein